MQANKLSVGVIIAGGQSRRMGGGDKCLLSLDKSTTIIQRTLARAAPQVDSLLLNCNGDERRFSFINIPTVKDIFIGWRGPLAGIHASLRWMKTNQPEAQWLASFAADTPFFPADLVAQLHAQARDDKQEIVVATCNQVMQPLFALWNISLLEKLENHLQHNGNPKMQSWVSAQKFTGVEITGCGGDAFFNINTPADFDKAIVLERQQ